MHSLSRIKPEVGCVPRPPRDGRLAGSIPPHGSPPSFPSHVGSLHHHLPLPDDPPLDRTFIQKVRTIGQNISVGIKCLLYSQWELYCEIFVCHCSTVHVRVCRSHDECLWKFNPQITSLIQWNLWKQTPPITETSKPPQCGQESTVPYYSLYYSVQYQETSVLRTPPK